MVDASGKLLRDQCQGRLGQGLGPVQPAGFRRRRTPQIESAADAASTVTRRVTWRDPPGSKGFAVAAGRDLKADQADYH
jgi:hypothetical protein